MSNYIIDYLTSGSDAGMEKQAAGIMRGLGRIGRKYFPTFTRWGRAIKQSIKEYPESFALGVPLLGAAGGLGAVTAYNGFKNSLKNRKNSADPWTSAGAWREQYIKDGMDPNEADYQYASHILKHPNSGQYADEKGYADWKWDLKRKQLDATRNMMYPYVQEGKPIPTYLQRRYGFPKTD